MFTELYPLAVNTRFAMLVTADAEHGVMTISVMPRPKQEAKAAVARDLTLTATPEEFDTGFVSALAGYRAKLVPLLEQAEAANHAIGAARATRQKQSATTSKPSTPVKASSANPPPRRLAIEEGDDKENPNEDPDTDWMKNRQPQLF
jgi:PRTRC genetic system protein E